nr:MAG TPA: hypothetical protein [Caudoviricetes sp.]
MRKIPPPQINKYYNNYIAISFAYGMIFFIFFRSTYWIMCRTCRPLKCL